MKKKLQNLLTQQGFGHFIVIDKDHVKCVVDGDPTIFSRDDQYGGHPLSGLASFGSVQGDHRMISTIAEDVQQVFDIISNN